MKRHVIAALLFLAVCLDVSGAVGAWAEDPEYMWISNAFDAAIIDGQVYYESTGPAADLNLGFHFTSVRLNPQGITSPISAQVTLRLKNPVTVYYGGEFWNTEEISGTQTFGFGSIHADGLYDLANADGAEVSLHEGAETAFSGQPFSVQGDVEFEGVFPEIKTFAWQRENCFPTVELVESGNQVVKVKWRLEDKAHPGVALTKDAGDTYPQALEPEIRLGSESNETSILFDFVRFGEGDLMQGEITLPAPKPLEEINSVRIRVDYAYSGERSFNGYYWRFFLNPGDETNPVDGTPLTEEELAKAKELIELVEIAQAEESKFEFNQSVNFDASGQFSLNYASSAVSIKQEAAEGGAVALAKNILLPVNGKSLGGQVLPQPKDLGELRAAYRVLKSFESGGAVDLLEWYGEDGIFDVAESTLILKAAVIVVNDAAPAETPGDGIKRPPFGGGKYGTKLVEDEDSGDFYLYIYDGYRDEYASDPIALVKKADDSGGGGCDAGFGAFALALAGLGLALRGKSR
jgi:hypothetical protein